MSIRLRQASTRVLRIKILKGNTLHLSGDAQYNIKYIRLLEKNKKTYTYHLVQGEGEGKPGLEDLGHESRK